MSIRDEFRVQFFQKLFSDNFFLNLRLQITKKFYFDILLFIVKNKYEYITCL